MANIKEKYNLLKKKYSLPDYETLNQEFDIEEINAESELVLQKLRIKIYEKMDFYAKLFESILQPESSLADLYEAHYVEEHIKNSAYSLFKRLVHILRSSNLVSVNNKEEDNAKFIKEAMQEWNSIKPEIQSHIKRLIGLWEKETDIREDLSYFG